MDDLRTLRLRVWAGGLVWGGFLLLIAIGFTTAFVGEIRDARAEVPTLSPTSLAGLDLNRYQATLVDVEGFEIDCEAAIFGGERLLAPGLAGEHPAMILVAFKHSSDCREAVAALRGPLRAKAKPVTEELLAKLGVDAAEVVGLEIAVVEPHEVGFWWIAAILFFGGVGVLGVHSAVSTRQRLLARPRREAPAWAEEEHGAAEADDRSALDPYRPGGRVRLIPEAITPAPKFLARLRRTRMFQRGIGVALVSAALVSGGWLGSSIYDHERLWTGGEVAPDAFASGEVQRSLGIFVRTKLDVTFVDQAGTLHRESLSGSSLFVGVDDSVVPEVRYIPGEPEHFAVSWIHEQLWGALAMLLVTVAGLSGLGLLVLHKARHNRQPEQAAAVFDDPREALLELMSIDHQVVNGSETGVLTYHFRIADSDRGWDYTIPEKQPRPLFLDGAQALALGLYHPRDPDYLLVLSEDLSELCDPPFSPAQLRGRFRGEGVQ